MPMAEVPNTDELRILTKMIRLNMEPEIVIEVGARSKDVADHLTMIARCPVLSTFKGDEVENPAGSGRAGPGAISFLEKKHALVFLTDPEPNTVFEWALLLRPGSFLVIRSERRDWPKFSHIDVKPFEVPRVNMSWRIPSNTLVLKKQRPPKEFPTPPDKPTTRRMPKRPLRSVFLGDLSYCSAYRLGISQGMSLLGAWHRDVSIREGSKVDVQVREMRPDLIFTHMLLWPPPRHAQLNELLDYAVAWRKEWGAVVMIHDGDPRPSTRFPHDVSHAVDLALMNHTRPVVEWNVPTLHWPYAAFTQDEIGDPVPELQTDLVFTGRMREGSFYGPRSECVRKLAARTKMKIYPGEDGINNRMQVADISASCVATIGFGRPEAPGWIDTRVFSVPGSGGVLLHDDVGGILEPNVHYVPYERYNVDSMLKALEHARAHRDEISREGFKFVQTHHTYRHRCQQVVDLLFE